jgi:hypothetical protein
LAQVALAGVYVGKRVIRTYGDRIYIHVPAKTIKATGLAKDKRVKVTLVVDTSRCQTTQYHGAVIKFIGRLVKTGRFESSYRITIPSNYWPLAKLANCATVDVWLGRLEEEPKGEPERVFVIEEG